MCFRSGQSQGLVEVVGDTVRDRLAARAARARRRTARRRSRRAPPARGLPRGTRAPCRGRTPLPATRRRSGSTSSRDLPRAGGFTGSRTTNEVTIVSILSGSFWALSSGAASGDRPSSLTRTPAQVPGRPSESFECRREGRRDGPTGATAAAEARLGLQPGRAHPQAGCWSPRRSAPGSTARRSRRPGAASWSFNHVSHVDPLTAAHIVYDHGRMPRYLAKSGLFKNRALVVVPHRCRADPGRAPEPRTPRAPSTPRSRRSGPVSASWSIPRAR